MIYFSVKNKNSGFSLVEVLVAITILLFVIVGPMQIISRSINSTSFASEQVNAWFLAQEGLELAQKGRDDLVLADFKDQINGTNVAPAPFTQFASDFSSCFTGGCGLNIGNRTVDPVAVTNCSTATNCKLYIDNSSARSTYQHTSAGTVSTPYTRIITMQRFPAAGKVREIQVTSTVTWRTGSLISSQKVETVTYLFNVYDTN